MSIPIYKTGRQTLPRWSACLKRQFAEFHKNLIQNKELIEIVVDSKGNVDYAGGLIITDKDSILRDPNSLLAVYYPNKKLIAVYLDAIEEM